MDTQSSSMSTRRGTPGLDIFKIAGRSISGFLPSFKTGDSRKARQPFTTQLEERLALYLEYHPMFAPTSVVMQAKHLHKLAISTHHWAHPTVSLICMTANPMNIFQILWEPFAMEVSSSLKQDGKLKSAKDRQWQKPKVASRLRNPQRGCILDRNR